MPTAKNIHNIFFKMAKCKTGPILQIFPTGGEEVEFCEIKTHSGK